MEAFSPVRTELVCQLLCSIYRLQQSGRLWNQKVVAFFTSLRFVALNVDLSILIHQEGGRENVNMIMVNVYIDDFLLAAKQ